MLVSRRLGKLISGAYDSLILFIKNSLSAAEAKPWCDHSNSGEKSLALALAGHSVGV